MEVSTTLPIMEISTTLPILEVSTILPILEVSWESRLNIPKDFSEFLKPRGPGLSKYTCFQNKNWQHEMEIVLQFDDYEEPYL